MFQGLQEALVTGMRFLIPGLAQARLFAETTALVLGVVQFTERVGELLPGNEELEAYINNLLTELSG